jgi:hypothetical protein
MKINIHITTTIFDKRTGKRIRRYHDNANSLVVAFIDLLYSMFGYQLGPAAYNTAHSSMFTRYTMLLTAAAADATKGIVVGTNDTPVAITNYALGAQINHGTGNGQLSYGALIWTQAPIVSGSSCSFKFMRILTNNSAGDITIKEVGIIAQDTQTTLFLIDRTVPTPKTLTPTQGTTIEYTFTITV